MKKEKIKICFAASSGGHYEQLMMLKPLMEKYDSFVVTEKTDYNAKAKGRKNVLYVSSEPKRKNFYLENDSKYFFIFESLFERKA